MIQWLRTFINQKKHCLVQPNESESENVNKENNLTVANPPITKHKGRPETKRYKAATEKPSNQLHKEKQSRQPYTCHSCGETGHNVKKKVMYNVYTICWVKDRLLKALA
ncbi:13050_t:CDS:1 [Dentiscutata erythropus]|uniref:13050_t:CDS:1 n=1 Tax=Dentiscutata erythropus TaxID=1348616 RepID=A0A9N9GTF5_9GLOM|nr:13050_t:CDS:1 [Dentiscutata erythropus]